MLHITSKTESALCWLPISCTKSNSHETLAATGSACCWLRRTIGSLRSDAVEYQLRREATTAQFDSGLSGFAAEIAWNIWLAIDRRSPRDRQDQTVIKNRCTLTMQIKSPRVQWRKVRKPKILVPYGKIRLAEAHIK